MPVEHGGDKFGVLQFGVLRVDEDVVAVEVVVPEVGSGDGGVIWDQGFEDWQVVR